MCSFCDEAETQYDTGDWIASRDGYVVTNLKVDAHWLDFGVTREVILGSRIFFFKFSVSCLQIRARSEAKYLN